MKKLALLVMLTMLVLCLIPCALAATQYDQNVNFTITHATETDNYYLDCTTIKELSYDEAVAANLPEGFSGSVWKIGGDIAGNEGAMIDFPNDKIKVSNIHSITFRLYAPPAKRANSEPNIRISGSGPKWIWGAGTSVPNSSQFATHPDTWTETWCDITIKSSDFGFVNLDFDKDGYLDRFNLTHHRNGYQNALYVDTITIDYDKEPDYTQVCEIRNSPTSANPPYPGTVTWYSEKVAAQKGAPGVAGVDYKGDVWYAVDTVNGSGVGVNLDFTKMKIPADAVKSVTIRYYTNLDPRGENYARFSPLDGVPAGSNNYCYWFTGSYKIKTGEWYEYTLTEEFLVKEAEQKTSFSTLKDSNGYFTGFGFNIKNVDYMWVDSVTVDYDEAPDYTEVCEIKNSIGSRNPPYPGTVVCYGEELAALRGAPGVAGVDYDGHVWKVSTSTGSGVGANLDFTKMQIPANKIKSVTIRVWTPNDGTSTTQPNVRLSHLNTTDPGTNDYLVDGSIKIAANQWVDYKITEEFMVSKNSSFADLKDSNGYFTGFGFNLRRDSNKYMWIDSVTVECEPEIDGEMLGAQIRTTAPQGLRFGTTVNFTDDIALEDIEYTYVEGGAADLCYAGTIILPVSELPTGVTADTLTHANAPANNFADVKAAKIYTSDATSATYTAVVYNIPDSKKATEIIARAYIFHNGDYYYFDPIVRSVSQVEEAIGNSNENWNND